MKIALIHSEDTPSSSLGTLLQATNYYCVEINSNKIFSQKKETYDLFLIDWRARSDLALIHTLKTQAPHVPILLIAHHLERDHLLAALQAGADDYLIQSVRRHELITRIAILLHRAHPERYADAQLQFDDYCFELNTKRITKSQQPIHVTHKEFDLALLLFKHLGQPLSRATISEAIWTHEPDVSSRTVDTHISRVRRKLQLQPEHGYRLTPVYSYGYQLTRLAE